LKDLKQFYIDILNLSNKKHEFEFVGDDSFFVLFEQSLIQKGSFNAKLTIDKSETMMQLFFQIKGVVELICDRTLEPFDYPLELDQKLILKYGEETQELTDEIEIISRDAQRINVAQYIYEFIGLAIPMKKIHPKLAGETYTESEDGILVYSSQPGAGLDSITEEEENMDPRWQALKKLNNN
jgi:uncharacterized metal-binding protein YceD (DUF177 family)